MRHPGSGYANDCTMPYAVDVTDFAPIVEQRNPAPPGYEMRKEAVAAVCPLVDSHCWENGWKGRARPFGLLEANPHCRPITFQLRIDTTRMKVSAEADLP
jgi:hypothetical protein